MSNTLNRRAFIARSLAAAPAAAVAARMVSAGAAEAAKAPEVLIFSGFAGEMLDVFLAAYKKAGIAPIPLKAVHTEHNNKWSLYALCEELRREHAAMLLRGSFGK